MAETSGRHCEERQRRGNLAAHFVIPAQAGIHVEAGLDARFHGHDKRGRARRRRDCFAPLAMTSRSRRRRNEGGFTLAEVLVSLGVFSIAAMALLNLKGESAQTVGRLEARALAGVVAENRMIELMSARQAPGLGIRRGEVRMAGRAWAWSETVFATDDADLRRVEISVELGDEGEVASLTAFRSLQ